MSCDSTGRAAGGHCLAVLCAAFGPGQALSQYPKVKFQYPKVRFCVLLMSLH